MNNPTIKTAKKFGSSSHIILDKEDTNKKFLVFPESSKFLLKDLMSKYKDSFDSLVNPLASDFLTKEEMKAIKTIYKIKIKKIENAVHRGFLINSLEGLDSLRVNDIGVILNDIENELPLKLRRKIFKEYYGNF